jgi:hypothetical protein
MREGAARASANFPRQKREWSAPKIPPIV